MLKLKEDGYVYVSPKTNRKYHLLEGISLGGTTTSDIVIIFDYQNDIDVDNEGKIVGWFYGATFVGNAEGDTKDIVANFVDKYEKEMEVNNMEDKKMRLVSPAEFITAWNEMEKYWINNDGDMDENSYYNRIISQDINIELPLLGIKTKLFWCPPTVECLDDMFDRMVEETYLELLVKKEDCFNAGGGIWLAEVPFEYGGKQLVMVVDNEDSKEWAIYQNVLKDNGKYESVEYEELMEFTGNANNILPDFQIYYIRALQLLADR